MFYRRSTAAKRTRDDNSSGMESNHQRRFAGLGSITIQPSIRTYTGASFDTQDTAKTTTGRFAMAEEGAQQEASLCGIDVTSVSQRDHFGIGRSGSPVSLDHRVETLFSLLVYLAQLS